LTAVEGIVVLVLLGLAVACGISIGRALSGEWP